MTDLPFTTIETGSSRSPRRRWLTRGVPIALGLAALALLAAGCISAANVANDTLTIKGSSGADTIVLRLKAGDPNTVEADDGIDNTDFSFDRQTFSKIVVDGGGGDDTIRIDHSNGVFTDTEITTLSGGDGNDTLIGDVGAETLDGGAGDDVLDGNQGADTMVGGAGNDTFQWDPGEASDTIDGGTGVDRLAFNGSNIGELFDVSANGSHVRFTRNVAAITMDLVHVETLDVAALGGADVLTVHDLTGTDLTSVNPDFAGFGGVDDGAQDDVAVPVGTTIEQDPTDSTVTRVTGLGALVRVRNAAPTDRIHVIGTAPTGSVTIAGTSAADAVNATANGTDVAVFPTFGATPGVRVDLTAVPTLVVNFGDGDDSFSATGNLAPLVAMQVNGQDGHDTLLGGNGNDVLDGGAGDDFLDGNQGVDTLLGGAANDTVQWDPGDGSDVVDGGTGVDRLAFNGSNIGELFDVSANGSHVRFTRNVATVTMDLDHIETLDVAALGGADVLTVHDLTGTDLTSVNPDFAGFGGVDDGAQDDVAVPVGTTVGQDPTDGTVTTVTGLGALVRVHDAAPTDRIHVIGTGPTGRVTIAGTAAADAVDATANGTDVAVFPTFGTTPGVRVDLTAVPTLVVNLGDGDDSFTATGNLAPLVAMQVNGQDGRDTLRGGNGNDVLDGGTGDDFLDGNQGVDTLLGASGNDTVQWDPGDGSDVVDGGTGTDRLAFNGSNIGELFDVSASGSHVRFTRNVATVTMDLVHVETLDVAAFGGVDALTVNDLTGTDLTTVTANLGGFDGLADGSADQVIVNGTPGDDTVSIAAVGTAVEARGLAATVRITAAEPTLDLLTVNGLAGTDTITPTAEAAALILLNLVP